MSEIKNLLILLVAIALVVLALLWMFSDSILKHIPDTNGPEDFSLTTITDSNIINRDMGSIGIVGVSQNILNGDSYKFSSQKFTGVYQILYDNFIGKSDFVLNLTNFVVTEGNVRLVVIHNDQIVAELTPDTFIEYRLEDISGTVALRIAGESATFSFFMTGNSYNSHVHP